MTRIRIFSFVVFFLSGACLEIRGEVRPEVLKEIQRYSVIGIAAIDERDGWIPQIMLRGKVSDVAPERFRLSKATRRAATGRRILFLLSKDTDSNQSLIAVASEKGRISLRIRRSDFVVDLEELTQCFPDAVWLERVPD